MRFMFHTNWEGEIERVTAALEPAVKDIVFTKRVAKPAK
jgi:hypothetical protein